MTTSTNWFAASPARTAADVAASEVRVSSGALAVRAHPARAGCGRPRDRHRPRRAAQLRAAQFGGRQRFLRPRARWWAPTSRSCRASVPARTFMDSRGSYSIVNSWRHPMETWDIVLTPGGHLHGHGHGHDGSAQAFWFDCLDIPLGHLLEPMSTEEHPDGGDSNAVREDRSPMLRAGGHGTAARRARRRRVAEGRASFRDHGGAAGRFDADDHDQGAPRGQGLVRQRLPSQRQLDLRGA